MGKSFGELLRRLLAQFDILYVDPMLPAFRELAAPALRAAVEAAPELSALLLERNRELAAAGYHAQVHIEDHTSLVFLLENGKRLNLRRTGKENEYVHNSRRFTAQELMDRAASLSPNAILRPVIQDSMLPDGRLHRRSRRDRVLRAVAGALPRAARPHARRPAAHRLHHPRYARAKS